LDFYYGQTKAAGPPGAICSINSLPAAAPTGAPVIGLTGPFVLL
jgi:hypothetical protein